MLMGLLIAAKIDTRFLWYLGTQHLDAVRRTCSHRAARPRFSQDQSR